MIIYVDIDETICEHKNSNPNESRDYSKATPLIDNISLVNNLYDEGNEIIYWTARGSGTGLDWTELTKNQLEEWNVKHHELKMGKPHYDLLICDKTKRIEEI
jgi:uncharacterized HAD superfamily protein